MTLFSIRHICCLSSLIAGLSTSWVSGCGACFSFYSLRVLDVLSLFFMILPTWWIFSTAGDSWPEKSTRKLFIMLVTFASATLSLYCPRPSLTWFAPFIFEIWSCCTAIMSLWKSNILSRDFTWLWAPLGVLPGKMVWHLFLTANIALLMSSICFS